MAQGTDLLRLAFGPNGELTLTATWLIWGLALIGLIVLAGWKLYQGGLILNREFEIDEAEVGIGDQRFRFRPNELDRQVAYKIWVELSTRKIGIPIDLSDDVVSEVYDSWFSFFSLTRELIKEIPVSKVMQPSTEKIIRMSTDVLNVGLRPHLTKWQARFRRWYEKELENANQDVAPQDVQKRYPH